MLNSMAGTYDAYVLEAGHDTELGRVNWTYPGVESINQLSKSDD